MGVHVFFCKNYFYFPKIAYFRKFVQNPEKTSLEFVRDWYRLKCLMMNLNIELLDIQYTPGDRTITVSYKKGSFPGDQMESSFYSIIIGVLTTCYGRIRLYRYLSQLGLRLFYAGMPLSYIFSLH